MEFLRKIKIAALFLCLALLAGCSRDYVEPNEFSDVSWYTSNFRESTFRVGIDDFMSFSDLSHNPLSHKWEIAEGNLFLKGPMTRSDTLLDKFVIPGAGLETSDKTIHVYFKKGGIQPVRLYNTYRDSVAYYGTDTVYSKKIGDVWVIDHTFMVDVYDTIQPQIQIRQDGKVIPLSKDTIYVEAGGKLEFVDLTKIGRPDTRSWTIAGVSSADSVAAITFKKLGTYSASFNSSRQQPNFPPENAHIKVPNPIKVIKSTKPFVMTGKISELEDETIQIPFNGEFAPFIGQEKFFTVTINGRAGKIQSVTPNAKDATLLNIKLAERIYRPDVIKVSFLPGSTLSSTDERTPATFTDLPVAMHDVNLLPVATYGFEAGGTGWVPMWDNAAAYEFSTTNVASGKYSMKIVTTTGKGAFTSEKAPFDLKSGTTYIYRYKIWVDPASPSASINTWILPNYQQMWQPLKDVKTGKWETVTRDVEYSGDPKNRFLYIHVPEAGTFYFDDFYLVEKEERPK
ncbi:hypothetical protein [Persicitalea jodogahamensis]|uniref:CBM-cenC domain-containing protein n=1 Tax=Persicitalea jodogahamensis TaxID=402147 RepID=A0A8J3D7B2_9BACT|nr:hypothetical protein [Persicitalea jodogahamensis]GHB63728.1 hypothetical protein GCM10007390_16950 [Persicitalea jodogahamensis]